MKQLRDKESGCPWDVEQTHASIAPYCIEEAYEVVEAINNNDTNELCAELGDLLLQVVFHSQMANEAGNFDFEKVAEQICEKMIRRHPHVFGDEDSPTLKEYQGNWEALKAQERAEKKIDSILDDVPNALPALVRAEKLQKRAARVGFDWPSTEFVYDKIAEELAEVKDAQSQEHQKEEIGDVLFVLANLARHHKIDPEDALRDANKKFERRFKYIENCLKAADKKLEESSLEEMDKLWNEAKAHDKAA